MRTLDGLFVSFNGPAKVGQALGISTEHAAAMKRRKSIPVDYWPQLIAAARAESIRGVTYESLALMHAKPKRGSARAEARAAS